jgi:hypothetical protein
MLHVIITLTVLSCTSPCSNVLNAAVGERGDTRPRSAARRRHKVERPRADGDAECDDCRARCLSRDGRGGSREAHGERCAHQMAEQQNRELGAVHMSAVRRPERNGGNARHERHHPRRRERERLDREHGTHRRGRLHEQRPGAGRAFRREKSNDDERKQERGRDVVRAERGHENAVERVHPLRERRASARGTAHLSEGLHRRDELMADHCPDKHQQDHHCR